MLFKNSFTLLPVFWSIFLFFLKETEVPDIVLKRLKVPSLENVEFRKIKQFFTYENVAGETDFKPISDGFQSFKNLKHLQMQVDHLENTKFVQVAKSNFKPVLYV